MSRKNIRIKLRSKCDSKLLFCKIIKDATLKSLRESKDFVDDVCNNIGAFKDIELADTYTNSDGDIIKPKELIKRINDIGEFDIVDGLSYNRNLSILKLGICDNEDYIQFILDYLSSNPHAISEILTNLSKDELVGIVDKISKMV